MNKLIGSVIIIEACKYHPDPKFRFHFKDMDDWIRNYGYKEIYADHINSIYVPVV